MPIALVSKVTAAGLDGATTASIDTTGATLLVIAVSYGAAITVSDSKGNTWTALTERNATSFQHRIYYVANPTVGTGHTFTVSGSSVAAAFSASAWSGVVTTSPFDTQQGGVATTATVAGIGSANLVPSEANELIFASVGFLDSVSGFGANTGFTLVDHVNFSSGSNYGFGAVYQVQTTATTISNATVVSQWTGSTTAAVASATFKEGAAPGATATTLGGPTSGTVGVASSNFTAGANGTITGTVTITPSDGGAGGTFTPTTVNISSGTPTATFTYTAASAGAKTISISDNGGLTDATPITYTAAAAGNPTAGTASLTSTTATTINVTCGAASGGTPSYTYQWYRSPTANFTPGGGTLLSGATSLTLADSTGLSADTPYYYRLRVTDSLSNVGDSNEIAGVLKAATLSIGFLGDSITNAFGLSAGQGPADQAGNLLVKLYKNRAVTVTEYAVDNSRTAQWVSGSANLIAAKDAFASASATHVHVMLGANDSAAANLVSAATYKSNLQSTVTDLTGAGYKVILSYPTYIPAGANSNATTAASVALAQSYQAEIDDLIDGVNVLRGDVLSYNYFIANLGEYQADKTHPTSTGATSLGYMWARAIERAIFFLDKPVPTKTVTVTFKDRAGAVQANLTGLKWQWSDFPGQPIDYGTGETTDASGVFTVSVRSYLQTGDVGFLEVTNAAGVVNTTYLSFAGPAPIA